GTADAPGWDGEYGPYFEEVPRAGGAAVEVVNYCSIWRSDYVQNALRGAISGRVFASVTTEELIARMDCLRLCIQVLPDARTALFPSKKPVSPTPLWLVSATAIDDWTTIPGAAPTLAGRGYVFAFVVPTDDAPAAIGGTPRR